MERPQAAHETARRVRAALAYANIDIKNDSDEQIGIGKATMARIVSPTNPRGFKSVEELWKIADACKVPREFLQRGFYWATEIDADLDEDEDDLTRMQKSIASLTAGQAQLRRELEALRDTGRQAGRGEGDR